MRGTDRLLAAVHSEQRTERVVVQAKRGRLPVSGRRGREPQVLADVPGIDQRVAVPAVRIALAVAGEDVRQQDHRGGVLERGRTLERAKHLLPQRARAEHDELVIHDCVVVEAGREPANALGHHVDLARVERAGRRSRPEVEHAIPAAESPRDSVREVEKAG